MQFKIFNKIRFAMLVIPAVIVLASTNVFGQEVAEGPKPAWSSLSDSERRDVLAFAEDYKDFMSRA